MNSHGKRSVDAANRRSAWRGVVSAAAACACMMGAAGCHSSRFLTVEDHVCRAGDDVTLIGKLEYRGVYIFNRGTDDKHLHFFLDGRPIGNDETNEEGYARVNCDFHEPGVHRLVVAHGRDGVWDAEDAAAVFVWQKHEPILVVDVDYTVADTRVRDLLSLFGTEESEPMTDSPEVLGELARSFHVVYLTARPRELIPKTREWMNRHGYPAGPLLTWDMDRHPWSQGEYKRERIDDLQDHFEAVNIGIGDRSHDREAYWKRNLFPIMLEPDSPVSVDDAVYLPDWSAIRELFARNPQLFSPKLRRDEPVSLPIR